MTEVAQVLDTYRTINREDTVRAKHTNNSSNHKEKYDSLFVTNVTFY